MEIQTILGRVLEGKFSKDVRNILTLINQQREAVRVYQGDVITQQQFEELTYKAAFITLYKNEYEQPPTITTIIKPFAISGYQNIV